MEFSYVILSKHFCFQGLKRLKECLLVYLFSHFLFLFFSQKLLSSGDIETYPGPRHNLNNHFTTCHWNVSSISAHNSAKFCTNLTLHAFLKLTWTLVSFLMMTTWTYAAISCSGLIIKLIVNLEVYVCIVKIVYHYSSLISDFFTKA